MTLDRVPASSRIFFLDSTMLVVAAARELGIESLASADADFRRVGEMTLYRPGDLG